jgi:hypothetical protein
MSRRLTTVFLAMLVLTAAMGLKTIAATRGNGEVVMLNGSAPAPAPWKNGSAPAPAPWKNGSAPAPAPWKNGSAPAPAPW